MSVGKDILGDMEGPDYIGVKFTGSNLTDAGFKNATLLGANFTGAHLENANFEGAVITGSLFEKKHLEQVRFSDEQLESIQIYCERHQISAMPN